MNPHIEKGLKLALTVLPFLIWAVMAAFLLGLTRHAVRSEDFFLPAPLLMLWSVIWLLPLANLILGTRALHLAQARRSADE